MKSVFSLLAAICISCSVPRAFSDVAPPKTENLESGQKKIEVHFSPKGGCTAEAVKLITSAKTEVLVQAYSFTSKPIIAALGEKSAPAAGSSNTPIAVRAILDRSDADQQVVVDLHSNSVEVRIDAKHAIAHNKVIIIDRKVVFTGSFNFTQQAETSNAENCLTIRDADIAGQYVANWFTHQAHSALLE